MPLFALSLIVQIGLVIHIVKTGRDTKWIYFVLIFPLVGSVAYFVIEMLPSIGRSRTVRKANRAVKDTLDPNWDIRAHAEALDIADTIENKLNLGAALREKGHLQEALELYRQARSGLYQFDPQLMLAEAETLYSLAVYRQACEVLQQLIDKNPDFESPEGHLLYAKSLEGDEQYDKAIEEYRALVQYYAGPEPKCRLAALLQRRGRETEGRALYNEVLVAAKRNSRHYNRLHREWVQAAKQALAQQPDAGKADA